MTATVYDAFRLDANDQAVALGRIAIEGGRLAIVGLLDEREREAVQRALDSLNSQPFLVVQAPPAAGGERYDIGAKELERGEPGFDEMLIRKLESNRRIRLTPAK